MIIEAVPGVNFEPKQVCLPGAGDEPFGFNLPGLFIPKVFSKCPRVQLDELAAALSGGLDLSRIWCDKQAHLDTGIVQAFSSFGERIQVRHNVQATLSGYLLSPFWNQTSDVRLKLKGQRQDFLRIGHFKI